jgi:prepilin-type N-terminal cleavage/methylation domain-containing protein
MHNRRAFTLLETLVALVIIVAAVGGALVLSRAVVSGGQTSDDMAQAESLAEEGIAQVRQYIAVKRENSQDVVRLLFGAVPDFSNNLVVYTANQSSQAGTLTGSYIQQRCFRRISRATGQVGALVGELGGACAIDPTLPNRAGNKTIGEFSNQATGEEEIYLARTFETGIASAPNTRWYLDMATLGDTRSGSGESLTDIGLAWDGYVRSVMIIPQPGIISGSTATDQVVAVVSQVSNKKTGLTTKRHAIISLTTGKVTYGTLGVVFEQANTGPGSQNPGATPSATPTPTIAPTPLPTPTPTVRPTPTPTPTPTPIPTGRPSIRPTFEPVNPF